MSEALAQEMLSSLGLLDVEGLLGSSSYLEGAALRQDWKRLSRLALSNLLGNGDFAERLRKIRELPTCTEIKTDFTVEAPTLNAQCEFQDAAALQDALAHLGPWKKGPFSMFDFKLDGEWRSDFKWQRVLDLASPLAGRRVLDVGTGNGYFLYRAHGEGAHFVLGLEPSGLYTSQYLALQKCFQCPQIALLPISSDEFTQGCAAFDTVISMGVLYHRRSPLDHLAQLRSFLKPGGELILETIVVDGPPGHSLLPADRYAQMRNIWFLPSVSTLESWLLRMGFRGIQAGPVVTTSPREQRATSWTGNYSLVDFLDPANAEKTIEGHPAPKRVLITALAP